MANPLHGTAKLQCKCKQFLFCCLGLVFIFTVLIYSLLSLPIYLYRWTVCKVVAPFFGNRGRGLGGVVQGVGTTFAAELVGDLSSSEEVSPRCAIVASMTLRGEVEMDTVKNSVQTRWIDAMDETRELRYPEFRQHPGSWMGFHFWRQDKHFSLDNHLVQRRCDEGWTEVECEEFIRSYVEELINKPFANGRSPWELHLISGYRNSSLVEGGDNISVLILRCHHCLADGFSLFFAVFEDLLGVPVEECGVSTGSKSKPELGGNPLGKFVKYAGFPLRLLHDAGYESCLMASSTRSPWYVPEGKRTGRQLYARSGLIPISKVKGVRDKFGVSFTAVLLSSIAAGMARSSKSRGTSRELETLPIWVPLPLEGHPKKLRNHLTAAIVELPVGNGLSQLRRLQKSEEFFQRAKASLHPLIFQIAVKLFTTQLGPIAKRLTANRIAPAFLTTFPGPGLQVNGWGFDVLTSDFAAGLQPGVAGVGFMVLSYSDHIRIAATVENAVMDRNELQNLIQDVCKEIDTLYEIN